MAISTSTEALIGLYQQENSQSTDQIKQVEDLETNGYDLNLQNGDSFRIYGIQETLNFFNEPIEKIDTRIVELNTKIVGLQNTILAVGQAANACGCGGTGIKVWQPTTAYTAGEYVSTTAGNVYLIASNGTSGASEPSHTTGTVGIYTFVSSGYTGLGYLSLSDTTVVNDAIPYRGYAYTSPNPFAATSGTLTLGNVGVGTENLITTSTIGTYANDVGIARTTLPICPGVTDCTGYATSITNLSNQITTLQTERNGLITKSNYLKSKRSTYEIREFAFSNQKTELNAQISSNNDIITFLQDPANEEWL